MHTVVLAFHHRHFTLTFGYHIDDTAGTFFRQIDCQLFNRFTLLAIDFLDNDLRLTNLQLVTFTTHGFDQDRQVENAASIHQPRIGRICRNHSQGKVLVQFFHQTIIYMARCHELAVFPEKRRVIDRKQHRHRRFVDSNRRQRFRIIGIGNRFTDFKTFHTDNRTDITGLDSIYFRTPQPFEHVDFLDLRFHHRSVTLAKHDLLSFAQFATMHAPHSDTAYILGIVQRSNQHLGRAFQYLGFRNILDDSIQQSGNIFLRLFPIFRHPTLLGRTVDRREVELFLRCIKTEHQVEHHFLHLFRTTIRLVYLINDHNRFQA